MGATSDHMMVEAMESSCLDQRGPSMRLATIRPGFRLNVLILILRLVQMVRHGLVFDSYLQRQWCAHACARALTISQTLAQTVLHLICGILLVLMVDIGTESD